MEVFPLEEVIVAVTEDGVVDIHLTSCDMHIGNGRLDTYDSETETCVPLTFYKNGWELHYFIDLGWNPRMEYLEYGVKFAHVLDIFKP